jgi:iron complex outermembrane receptor protein
MSRRVLGRRVALIVPFVFACGYQAHAAETIEEIRVEAARLDLDDARAAAARVPGAVTVVDMAEVQQRTIATLADVLRYVPGVWSESASGTDAVFISSRGSNLDATDYDGNGVKILQDGLPVTTADGNNHNRFIDPLSAGFATVARGANGMSYGASTLGGAIDFISPTGLDRSGIEGRLNGGSHGFATARLTGAGRFADRGDGLLNVEQTRWDGYRDHNEQDRTGFYGNVGWQFDEALTTRFYGTYVTNDQELPGRLTAAQVDDDPDQAEAMAIAGDYALDVDTTRIANRTSWIIDDDRRFEFGVSYEDQTLFHPIVEVLVDFDDEGPLEPVSVFSLLIDTDHTNSGAMLRYQQSIGDHALEFGVNYGESEVDGAHYRHDAGVKTALSTLIDNEADSTEVFALDHWSLTDRLTVVFGAQAVFAEREARSTSVPSGVVVAPSDDYSAINPRLGAIYQIVEGATIYGNVSRLFEPPTVFELADDVRADGRALDAMSGTVVEIGTRGEHRIGGDASAFWDVAAYYAWISDEILSVDDPEAPGTSLSANVDDTIHAGLEALFGASFALGAGGHLLEPRVSVTLNQFEFDDDPLYGSNELPAAPDYAVRGEVIYRHPSGFYVGPTFDLVGERYADFANSYEVDDFGLLGIRGGFEGSSWRVFAEVQNALDEHYVSTFSVRNVANAGDAILSPGAPVSAYAGVEFAF